MLSIEVKVFGFRVVLSRDVEQELIEESEGRWWRSKLITKGSCACVAEHMPSGIKMVSDAPVDNQGRGESFSPTDMVATALGNMHCHHYGNYCGSAGD
jgi:hypothetical protein